MRKLIVSLGNRSYPIFIGKNNLQQLFGSLDDFIILTNKTVHRLVNKQIEKFRPIIIPDGEEYKNLDTVSRIYDQFIKLKAQRKTTLVALGGGVVGDIGGFAAATFLRGIPYIQIPTTLLAQVDSSVGGKTGVDLKQGKNLVGAFYQPKLVWIDLQFLKTLPRRDFISGLAEVAKYGLLWDEKLFAFIENNLGKILSLEQNTLEHLIKRSCEIKAHIVSMDEREAGLRSLLNLGHTLAHAVETLTDYRQYRHGEAVSIGIVYATRLSQHLGKLKAQDVLRIETLFKKIGLPTEMPFFPKKEYKKIIATDKKSTADKIRFILLHKIGKAYSSPIKLEEVIQLLRNWSA